ncbi:hypothetical protein IMSAG049_00767 [Clostridiales bacterium]|nr:hypothetical protein IMSAG049_00767 [Clostridiales bacterium]
MDDITQIIQKISENSQEICSIHETLDRHEDKLEKLQDEASTIEKLTYILEETRKTSETTTNTLIDITNTLSKMSVSIDMTNKRVEELSHAQDGIKDEMREVNNQVHAVDNKTKFDWISIVNKTLIPALLSSGIVYIVINLPK